jgi:hypothetical protein
MTLGECTQINNLGTAAMYFTSLISWPLSREVVPKKRKSIMWEKKHQFQINLKMTAVKKCCSFYKFGFCKFGMQCRKVHYSEICEQKFCENVKFCEKRHPRSCYYFCAYGFCKFGNDCKFKHETPPSRNHAS